MHRSHRAVLVLSLLCAAPLLTRPAHAQQMATKASGPVPPELLNVKQALEKYQDPIVAVRDGYFSTLACLTFADGSMGVHFLNMGTVGPVVDPMKPQVLLYEPVGDKLKLTGAEWFVPLATGVKERPSLLGQPFDGPMDGHEPLMPAELKHYDLHVWLWKDNPDGLYAPANTAVKCPNAAYSFTEKGTARQHADAHKHD